MKETYSNRQQKIYSDYSVYSTENLTEMVKSEKYVLEVREIMDDILLERNAFAETEESAENQSLELLHINTLDDELNKSPLRNHRLY